MPCIFFSNLPDVYSVKKTGGRPNFIPSEVIKLLAEVAELTGVEVEKINLFTTYTKYNRLDTDGFNHLHSNVHVVVEWHNGRDILVKQAIADALLVFFKAHSLYKGLDITFRDSPSGTFFVEKNGQAVLVPGGVPVHHHSDQPKSRGSGWG